METEVKKDIEVKKETEVKKDADDPQRPSTTLNDPVTLLPPCRYVTTLNDQVATLNHHVFE